jgi:hypothetical protein
MDFNGFTLPDGAYIPRELLDLIPALSGARLKVILIILYYKLNVKGEEPCSLTTIQRATGLSRPTVSDALAWLLRHKIIVREPLGPSYIYDIVVKFFNYPDSEDVKKFYYLEGDLLPNSSSSSFNLTTTTNLTNLTAEYKKDRKRLKGALKKSQLMKQLKAKGVNETIALEFVNKHDEEYITRHIAYYDYAESKKLAKGAGYLVASIREDWQPPINYQAERNSEEGRYKYKEWEKGDK